MLCHPGDGVVEALRESAVMRCPGDSRDKHTVFRAFDAMCLRLDFYDDTSEVESTPPLPYRSSVSFGRVISTALAPALRAAIIRAFVHSGHHFQMLYTFFVLIELNILYDYILDIQDLLD